MNESRIRRLLESLKAGAITVEDALEGLKHLPYEDLGFAKVDHHRVLRQGIPEVIFAKDKRAEDVIAIAESMIEKSRRVLITKSSEEVYNGLREVCMRYRLRAKFHEHSGVITVGGAKRKKGRVVVLCAGTSDIAVAEEAAVTASFLGSRVESVYDVGVAGLHRLLDVERSFSGARVLVVVAGMEGALPSVIGGITAKPIIAVPTSAGYGSSLGGLTALFSMLNSCVPGIAVMNIDNGFGAGVLAHKINML